MDSIYIVKIDDKYFFGHINGPIKSITEDFNFLYDLYSIEHHNNIELILFLTGSDFFGLDHEIIKKYDDMYGENFVQTNKFKNHLDNI